MKDSIDDFFLESYDLPEFNFSLLEEKPSPVLSSETDELSPPLGSLSPDHKLESVLKNKKRRLPEGLENPAESEHSKKRVLSGTGFFSAEAHPLIQKSKMLQKLNKEYLEKGPAGLESAITGLTQLEKIKLHCYVVQSWITKYAACRASYKEELKKLNEEYEKLVAPEQPPLDTTIIKLYAADVLARKNILELTIKHYTNMINELCDTYKQSIKDYRQLKNPVQQSAMSSTPSFTWSPT